MRRLRVVSTGVLALVITASAWAADPSLPASTAAPVAYLAVLQNGFSIRNIRQEVRPDGITRLYTSADDYVDIPSAQVASIQVEAQAPPLPAAALAPAPAPAVPELINTASGKHSVDPDFIRSVIRAESNFNPKAVSPKGAQGLMQLMPGTAHELGVADAFDPAANINAGTQYLRELLVQYHGDAAKALAAYNAGPQRVTQYKGVPPYRETRAYVRRVINDYNRTKKTQQTTVSANPKRAATARSSK